MTWPTEKVADVAAVFNGKTPSKLEQREAGHPVLKIKDVDENGKFRGCFSGFVDSSVAEKHQKKKLLGGESLILNAAHNASHVASKTFLADSHVIDSIATGEWLIIRWNDRRVDPRFGNYWVNADETRFKIRRMVNGIHLYPKDVARLQLPLPPLAEQKRIAGILDAAAALRAKCREAIGQLDALLKSTFIDMFGDPVTNPMGWATSPLAHICKTGAGGTPSRKEARRYYEGGTIPWVKSGELRESLITSTAEHITEAALKETNVKLVPKNALLLALYGATVGRLGVLGMEATTNQAVCHIIPDPKRVDRTYLFHSLANQVTYLVGRGVGGAQPNISQRIVKSLEIPLPPFETQARFAAIVEVVEQQKTRMHSHLAELDALFESLQSRAFNGEL